MADYSREEIQDLISTNVKVVLKGKDLSKLNLRGEELSDAELDGSNLNAINMEKTILINAKLNGVNAIAYSGDIVPPIPVI